MNEAPDAHSSFGTPSSPGAVTGDPRGPVRSLERQRCFHHGGREAVARCPSCRSYFCRECITEHNGQVICAACLRKETQASSIPSTGFAGVVRAGQIALGLLIALSFFYWLGQSLLELPASFHDGTLWRGHWLDEKP